MIIKYETTFTKHSGHGKEAELKVYHEIVSDFMLSSMNTPSEDAISALCRIVGQPEKWRMTKIERMES